MVQTPSLDVNSSSVSHRKTLILRNPNFYDGACNNLPLVPILSQINPVHSFILLWKMYFNHIFPFTPMPSRWTHSFRFPNHVYFGRFRYFIENVQVPVLGSSMVATAWSQEVVFPTPHSWGPTRPNRNLWDTRWWRTAHHSQCMHNTLHNRREILHQKRGSRPYTDNPLHINKWHFVRITHCSTSVLSQYTKQCIFFLLKHFTFNLQAGHHIAFYNVTNLYRITVNTNIN